MDKGKKIIRRKQRKMKNILKQAGLNIELLKHEYSQLPKFNYRNLKSKQCLNSGRRYPQ